ncbi:MAG: hypothetical protein QNJ32_08075 [Xenococcaceae cyanobacterium MO_167.B27]|nr:hypothetical protein [Xenococcaceae cyanobacterium MO_167.B27]
MKNRISDAELRRILKLPSNREGDRILKDLKERKYYESKEEFLQHFQGIVLPDLGVPFNPFNAWVSVIEKDQEILDELNQFLTSAENADRVRNGLEAENSGVFGGTSKVKIEDAIAELLIGQIFSNKEAFIKRLYELKYPDKDYN